MIPGYKFLHTTHLAVARLCDMIACRRVEMLLAENIQVWGEEGEGGVIPGDYFLHTMHLAIA